MAGVKEDWDRVQRMLGRDTICTRCGAVFADYADKCKAAFDEPCEGFTLIDQILKSDPAHRIAALAAETERKVGPQ